MSDQNQHWTHDPDLLERYVLGPVGEEEKKRLETHLRGCSSCRETVNREKTLIGGIRLLGREGMKERLRLRVGERGESRVPWPHIVSAAAVLVIVLGLGIYNRWWLIDDPVVQTEQQIGEAVAPKKIEGTGVDQVPPPSPSAEAPSSPMFRSEPSSKVGPADGAGVGRRDMAAQRERESFELKQREMRPADASEMAMMDEVTDDREKNEGISQVWLEGKVIRSLGEQTGRSSEARTKADAPAAMQSLGSDAFQPIDVVQKPEGELPASQKRMKKAGTVVTSLEQSKDRMNLVLYSDEFDLDRQEVTVDSPRKDSLVVTVNGTKIIYKIPQGLMQPAAKTK